MKELIDEIAALKNEKDAVVLAHYYVREEVQAIADYIGDSYYLSKIAMEINEKTIVFCGVSFMGESAKLLSPEKTVLMPDKIADCPMAHMADSDRIQEIRKEYPDVAVVCYVNSTAKLKAHSDVCVTSSNALHIVKNLPNKVIYFIPDENLARFVASNVPEKKFLFTEGFCHVHTSISAENINKAKEAKPDAKVLVHPECKLDVLNQADYIGSTSGIIDYAMASDAAEFIIGTEMGVLYELKQKNPKKNFYTVRHRQYCPSMKRVTLEKIKVVLQTGNNEVLLDEKTAIKAKAPLERMLQLAKG